MKYIVLFGFLFGLLYLPKWLQRTRHHDKKAAARQARIAESLKILELSPTATDDEIRAAHKRLIQKNHPDAGGSEYFAAKINEARDILLNNLRS